MCLFHLTRPTVEVQVNPEFSEAQAAAEADVYCTAIGRLPGFLLRDVSTVWIHRGDHGFGGGNDNLLIHTDRGEVGWAWAYYPSCALAQPPHGLLPCTGPGGAL